MKASQGVQSYSLMRLIVSNSGEHTVSVSQTDERCFSRNSDYDYSYCRMILAKIAKDSDSLESLELSYVKSAAGQNRETHIQVDSLDKGEYYLYVEMDWNPNTED